MQVISRSGFVITLLLLLAGDAAKNDSKDIQGNWTPMKAELSGNPVPAALLKTIRLRLDDGKYEAFVGDDPDRGTYTIDIAASPRAITVTGTEGPNKGKTFPAIYELDGNTLRICYDLSGVKRPAEFKTAAGTRQYLVTYTRKRD